MFLFVSGFRVWHDLLTTRSVRKFEILICCISTSYLNLNSLLENLNYKNHLSINSVTVFFVLENEDIRGRKSEGWSACSSLYFLPMNTLCSCREEFSLSCHLLSTILVLCSEDDKLDFFLSNPSTSPLG